MEPTGPAGGSSCPARIARVTIPSVSSVPASAGRAPADIPPPEPADDASGGAESGCRGATSTCFAGGPWGVCGTGAAETATGVATAFESPAEAALLPNVAPEGMLQRATALATGAFQVAMISGPAAGGVAYAISPGLPFVMMAVFWLFAAAMSGAIKVSGVESQKEPPTFESLFAGVKFVHSNPAILGTISLDLFAVLLGGATALLPIYARDILHTGPWGLGVLRAAPAAGRSVDDGLSRSSPDQPPCRNTDVPSRHRLRCGDRRFRAVAFGPAIACGAGHCRSSRHDQRRHTHLACAARDA